MSAIGKRADDIADNHQVMDTPCNCSAIRQAARRVTRLYDQALTPWGLRITQYPILSWLAAAGPMTMNVLAERIGMDRATIGHNLRPLEARGLVTMAAGADRRSRVVTLTEAGRQLLDDARPAWRAAQRTFESASGRLTQRPCAPRCSCWRGWIFPEIPLRASVPEHSYTD
jgi:DNA-binding MarR family transcriptional regulator